MKIAMKSVENIKGGRKPKQYQMEMGELLHTTSDGRSDAFTKIIQEEFVGRIIEVVPMVNDDGKEVPNWFTTVPCFVHDYDLNIHRSWFNEVD